MCYKEALLGTLAYSVVTFPVAVLWHALLFNDLYHQFGYFDGQPSFLLGFLSILIQGVVLSLLYPLVSLKGSAIVRSLKYASLLGLFFWTSHVLAFVAKQTVPNPVVFILMETGYLAVQFGVYGVLVGLIYRKRLSNDGFLSAT